MGDHLEIYAGRRSEDAEIQLRNGRITKFRHDLIVIVGLSHKEAEVVELVVQGLSSEEVGRQLHVSEKTVKFHLTTVFKKCRVDSRTRLMRMFLQGNPVVPPKFDKNQDFGKEALPIGF